MAKPVPDGVLRADWLTKQSVSAWRPFKNWRQRYMVLRSDKLTWCADDDVTKPRGALPLRADTSVTLQSDRSQLLVETGGRRLVLRGPEALLLAWCRAVSFVVSHADEAATGGCEQTIMCRPCEEDPRENTCGICLGELGAVRRSGSGGEVAVDDAAAGAEVQLRRCGHAFCAPCLAQHCKTQRAARRAAWCPICRRTLDLFDVISVSSDAAAAVAGAADEAGAAEGAAAELPQLTPQLAREREREARRAQRQFEAMAAAVHMRKCPHCAVPIIKNGGCNNMTCRGCHRHFRWDRAPTVVPCRQVHWATNGKCGAWCTTCPGAAPIAKVKLAAVRTVVLVAGGPVLVVGVVGGVALGLSLASLGLVVAAVPLALFGPLYLAYEPLHKSAEARRAEAHDAAQQERLRAWRQACAAARWAHLRALGARRLARAVRLAEAAPNDGQWVAVNTIPPYYFYERTWHTQWHRPGGPTASITWITEQGQPLRNQSHGRRRRPPIRDRNGGGGSTGEPEPSDERYPHNIPPPPPRRLLQEDPRPNRGLPIRPIVSRYRRRDNPLGTAAVAGAMVVHACMQCAFDDDD